VHISPANESFMRNEHYQNHYPTGNVITRSKALFEQTNRMTASRQCDYDRVRATDDSRVCFLLRVMPCLAHALSQDVYRTRLEQNASVSTVIGSISQSVLLPEHKSL
jgi:hypothetical protein